MTDLSRILLNETLEAYRYHVHKLQFLNSDSADGLDNGTNCPVCEGVSWRLLAKMVSKPL